MSETDPASPCIKVCAIDPLTRVCAGCHRTLDEITAWFTADAVLKRAILDRAAARSRA